MHAGRTEGFCRLIVGKGKNSKGCAKIKPAAIKCLKGKDRIQCVEAPDNDGVLLVHFLKDDLSSHVGVGNSTASAAEITTNTESSCVEGRKKGKKAKETKRGVNQPPVTENTEEVDADLAALYEMTKGIEEPDEKHSLVDSIVLSYVQ